MTDQLERLTTALADRYRIDRELRAGGMATVYLAEDLKHNRKVAVKVVKPELGVAIGAERFLAEIKTTANLQHPHILPLRMEQIDLRTGARSRLLPDFATHRAVVLSNPEVSLADDPRTYAYMERESASYLFGLKGMH